jgi:hypothetical protein
MTISAGLSAKAHDLVASMTLNPAGQVSPSVYETGRLVTLAPWLPGQSHRLKFLLATQRLDGGWGAPGGYTLVPTLSATEAILTALHRQDGGPARRLTEAADQALLLLSTSLQELKADALPDMPAVELIAASLIELINARLRTPPVGLEHWAAREPLHSPLEAESTLLPAIRALVESGGEVPQKLLHALEITGPAAASAPAVAPGPAIGTVGASPAATAAWLGGHPDPDGPAYRYLEETVRRFGGPAPCTTPITVFERAWVLTNLVRAGIELTVPRELTDSLEASLGPAGASAGEGLPADADTTAATLYALALLGKPLEPDHLWHYDTGSHFCTWPGEQGFSVTTNAHVLEAFGRHLKSGAPETPRYAEAVARLSAVLREHQRQDGSWYDRWHVSPYYATACCAFALSEFGGPESEAALARAQDWLISTQRGDGSWGHWSGTAEETSYAVQILLLPGGSGPADGGPSAVEDGLAVLAGTIDSTDHPALWHDKDLYLPLTIVRSSILAALHLGLKTLHFRTESDLSVAEVRPIAP